MNSIIRKTHSLITGNTVLYFRGILFLTFLGHGLVSLGFSPGYELHYHIFESVNAFNANPQKALYLLGSLDIFFATAILLGIFPRIILSIAILWLSTVAI